jgi:hypothetical protein
MPSRESVDVAAWISVICSNLLVGLGARFGKGNSILLLVLPLVVSIALLQIADIDSSRADLIRMIPQNLLSLSKSLHTW